MTEPLWQWDDLIAASRGTGEGTPSTPITGFSIDTRTIESGDVFVALKDQRDGHDFVSNAFQAGAAAAIVSTSYQRQPEDGPLVRTADPLAALEHIGRAARARLSPQARVVAVTGSAGKTGTKEMLRDCLKPFGTTHASEKSYNNHWGVPLTLARMPAGTRFGVFEIGMNHTGEITLLTQMVRPHIAVITTIAPVHLGHFANVDEIADAKAEIFDGIEPGGIAVLNRDNEYFDRLASAATQQKATIVAFGRDAACEMRYVECESSSPGARLVADLTGSKVEFCIGAPGEHLQMNALAALAVVKLVGADPQAAAAHLGNFEAPAGRGRQTVVTEPAGEHLVIDESYNANPASMRAALSVLGQVERTRFPRRIAVLGDMLELGDTADDHHRALLQPIVDADIDLVFACGPHMAQLFSELDDKVRGAYAPTSAELAPAVVSAVRAGDAVMVKGSLGSAMGPIVGALKSRLTSGH